jgi:hypothetical protein
VKANASQPSLIGYEILRRVEQAEVPGYPLNPDTQRAVLGTRAGQYVVPPGIDVFELGLLDTPGQFELLPITLDEKPLWDDVIHVLVTETQAEHQRSILFRSYQALHDLIIESDELDASITEWSARGATHPIFGMLRHATINVWKANRHGHEPLSERELDALHDRVARQVAAQINARTR